MTDLVYTDAEGVEQGVVSAYSFDLAYGSDENSFSLTLPVGMQLEPRSLVYLDGTEWGGVVRGCRESTMNGAPMFVATGPTWHGLLASAYVCPAVGEDHVAVAGEANAALAETIRRVGLEGVFDVSAEDSGIAVDHRFDRFVDCYGGVRKMLAASGAKLKIDKQPGRKPTLYAAPVRREDDSEAACRYGYEVGWKAPVNHLICLGKGELAARTVIHLYADGDGNVSGTQTLFGLDEVQEVYDYGSADDAELLEKGIEKLKGLQETWTCKMALPEGVEYDVGDVVGVLAEGSGKRVTTRVSKTIVKVDGDGMPSIAHEMEDPVVVEETRRTQKGAANGS